MREQFTQYAAVKRWLSNLPKESTRRVYTYALRQFIDFSGMNPDEIVALGMKRPEDLHDYMKAYYSSMPLASTTRMLRYQSLRSFCKANRIRLEAKPRTFKSVVEYESRRIFSQEQVTTLVDSAKRFRDKALITFLA